MKSIEFDPQLITRMNRVSYVHKPENKSELMMFFSDVKNEEALFIASPNLHTEFLKWKNNELPENKHTKVIDSLNKYASRMTGRCTPFGLFSGVSTTSWGDRTQNDLVQDSKVRKTRLDASFLFSLTNFIENNKELEHLIKYYPNNTIYTIGNKYRYVDYRYTNGVREYNISSVDFSEYINLILINSQNGKSLSELAELLVDDDVNFNDAFSFCKSLRDEKLLISEFDISITYNHTIDEIIAGIKKLNTEKTLDLVNTLDKVAKLLNSIDRSFSNEVSVYHDISSLLTEFGFSFTKEILFQVDYAYTEPQITFPKNIQNKFLKVLQTLSILHPEPNNSNLIQFIRKFQERYGDEEVPLLEALDNESGVGYMESADGTSDYKPFIEDLIPNIDFYRKEIIWDKTQAFLLSQLLKNKDKPLVTLKRDEIEKFMGSTTTEDKINDTFSCLFSVVSQDEDDCKIWLKDFIVGSASKLVNRFSHLDTSIQQVLSRISEIEENPEMDVVKAEIIHLPQNRTGNILFHAPFMRYEIPYLSTSGVEKKHQILPADLMISIINDEVIIRSKTLNKRIIPQLNTAHNFSGNDSLPVYHFLCELATQKKHASLYFTWGLLEDEFSFLPRVEIDDVIVSPAKWNLKKEDLSVFKDENNFLGKLNELISSKKIPHKFYVTEYDNLLLIDTGNELDLTSLKLVFKRSEYIQLTEYLFDEENMFVKNNAQEFLYNESVAILRNNKTELYVVPEINEKSNSIELNKNRRAEWIYFKIYTGVKTSEIILTETITPLTEELLKHKLIKKWFFIRYSDPHLHLRVRFHAIDKYKVQKYIDQYFENSQILEISSKIQIENYKPEITRYGSSTIDKAENIFFQDSLSTVNILSKIQGIEGEKIKVLTSICIIDQYLNCLNYPLQKKLNFISWLKDVFYQEFGVDKEFRKKLSSKYKEFFPLMDKFLKKTEDYVEDYSSIYEILDKRNKIIEPIIKELVELKMSDRLDVNIEDLTSSYIHMFINRMFRSNQRKQELMIYSILFQYYRSVIAIQKQQQKQKQFVS